MIYLNAFLTLLILLINSLCTDLDIPDMEIWGGEDITDQVTGVEFKASMGTINYKCTKVPIYWPHLGETAQIINACALSSSQCVTNLPKGDICHREEFTTSSGSRINYYSQLHTDIQVKEYEVLDCQYIDSSPGKVEYLDWDGWLEVPGEYVHTAAHLITEPVKRGYFTMTGGEVLMPSGPYLTIADATASLAQTIDVTNLGCSGALNTQLRIQKCNNYKDKCETKSEVPASLTQDLTDLPWGTDRVYTYSNLQLAQATTWVVTGVRYCWQFTPLGQATQYGGKCSNGYVASSKVTDDRFTLQPGVYSEVQIRVQEGQVHHKSSGIKSVTPAIPTTANYDPSAKTLTGILAKPSVYPNAATTEALNGDSYSMKIDARYSYSVRTWALPYQYKWCELEVNQVIDGVNKKVKQLDTCRFGESSANYENTAWEAHLPSLEAGLDKDTIEKNVLTMATMPVVSELTTLSEGCLNDVSKYLPELPDVVECKDWSNSRQDLLDYYCEVGEWDLSSYDPVALATHQSHLQKCLDARGILVVDMALLGEPTSEYATVVVNGPHRQVGAHLLMSSFPITLTDGSFASHVGIVGCAKVTIKAKDMPLYETNICSDPGLQISQQDIEDQQELYENNNLLTDIERLLQGTEVQTCPSPWSYSGWFDSCNDASYVYTILWLIALVLVIVGIIVLILYCKHVACFSPVATAKRVAKRKRRQQQKTMQAQQILLQAQIPIDGVNIESPDLEAIPVQTKPKQQLFSTLNLGDDLDPLVKSAISKLYVDASNLQKIQILHDTKKMDGVHYRPATYQEFINRYPPMTPDLKYSYIYSISEEQVPRNNEKTISDME